jgi:hypothetical protein
VVHGVTDRTTSAEASRAIVEALQERGITASFIGLQSADHAMLRRAGTWDHLVEGFLTASFLDRPEEGEKDDPPTDPTELGARAAEESVVTVI